MITFRNAGTGGRMGSLSLAFCWEGQGGGQKCPSSIKILYKTLKAELQFFFTSFLNNQFSRYLSNDKNRCGTVN